jgi:hypothetical protein
MVIDDIEVTVVDPFGDGTATTFDPVIDSDDTSVTPGVITLTPVDSTGAFADKKFIVMGWQSGDASGSWDGASDAEVSGGISGTMGFTWAGSNAATKEVAFTTPTTAYALGGWEVASIKFEDAAPSDYTLTFKITSNETSPSGNVTTMTVRNNGWGNPAIDETFLGDTKSDTEDDASAQFSVEDYDGTTMVALTLDTDFDSDLTDIGATELGLGTLESHWTRNEVLSTIKGVPGGDDGDDFGAFDGLDATITWTTKGDWESGDTMVFDAELEYDGVVIKLPVNLEIEVVS